MKKDKHTLICPTCYRSYRQASDLTARKCKHCAAKVVTIEEFQTQAPPSTPDDPPPVMKRSHHKNA